MKCQCCGQKIKAKKEPKGRFGCGVSKVNGITVHKRWNWTLDYAQHYSQQTQRAFKPNYAPMTF